MAMSTIDGYIVTTTSGKAAKISRLEGFELFQEVERSFAAEDIRLRLEYNGYTNVNDESILDICDNYLAMRDEDESWTDICDAAIKQYFSKEVKRVFISQPMTGRTVEDIKRERAEVMKEVKDRYPNCIIEEINSFNKDVLNDGDPITELGKCISLMSKADLVIFCKGWSKSRGCMVEHECADQYDLFTIHRGAV